MNMTRISTIQYKITALVVGICLLAGALALPAYAASQQTESTASITFTGGDLILVRADSITFEPGVVTSVDTEYDAENAVDIVISDNRGNEDGWQLTAQLGVFTVGTNEVLQNATITVSNVSVNKNSTDNNSPAPTPASQVRLVAGSGVAAPVATATAGQGGGGWTVTFAEADIELAVKADTARSGLATAQIDWVIADAA